MNRILRALRSMVPLLAAAGLLALGYVAYDYLAMRLYQQAQHQRFEARRHAARMTPAALAVPKVTMAADGDAIGEIQILRLGLTAMVIQGDSSANLRRGVGHLAETAWPGEEGNVVLAGHRDALFRPLKDVQAGDAITVKTLSGDFEYLVESTSVVPPSAIEVLEPTGGRTLTLITCFPFSYVGAAPNRFIVRARLNAQPVSQLETPP
ncbi:MAG: class D sortase [Vicinamibacterales bacterium]